MEKRVMNDEVRRKLAGILPFSPGGFVGHTPKAFEAVPEAYRPVFRLRSMNGEELAAARASLRAGEAWNQIVAKALQGSCLLGWSNLLDMDGNEIPYSKDAVALLPERLLNDLYTRVSIFTGISEEEQEGLGFSPPSTLTPSRSDAASAVDVPG